MKLGFLGAIAIGIFVSFLWLVVLSTLDIPGAIRPPEEVRNQLYSTVIAGAAALIGAAVVTFRGNGT